MDHGHKFVFTHGFYFHYTYKLGERREVTDI